MSDEPEKSYIFTKLIEDKAKQIKERREDLALFPSFKLIIPKNSLSKWVQHG